MFRLIKQIKPYYFFIFLIVAFLYVRLCFIFSFSTDLDGAEFAFIHNVQLLYKDIPLYRNPDAFPFYALMYMPLYYYILYTMTKLLSVNPIYEIHHLLIIARAINWGLIFINLFILFRIMSAFKVSVTIKWFMLLIFILLINGHIYAARPDGIKITLFIIEIAAILKYFYFNVQKKRFLLIIVFCNIISFMLKQDAVFYNTILLFSIIVTTKSKTSVRLFLCCILVTALSYVCSILIFGNYFFTNTFIYNFQSITRIENAYNITIIIFSLIRLLFLIILCSILYYNIKKEKLTTITTSFLFITIFPLFFTAHFFMFKSGGNINYSFELISVLILLTSKLFSEYTYVYSWNKKLTVFCLFYFLTLIKTNELLNNYILNDNKEKENIIYYQSHNKAAQKIKEIIKDDVFFIPDGADFIFYAACKNMFYGYEAHIDRFINLHYNQNIRTALLLASPDKVDNCFIDGTVKYIIIENNEKSTKHVQEYYPKYIMYKQVGIFNVFIFDALKK